MTATPRIAPRVRNRIAWLQRLARLGGSPVEHDLRAFDEPLADIARLEDEVAGLSDERITQRAVELRAGSEAGLALDTLQAPLFALVREAAGRTVGLRPFDVQVVAALSLARGRVVEMQTGEGKTLAAVMPAALHALTGDGVHVLTFNDYLAGRDAEWMGRVDNLLDAEHYPLLTGINCALHARVLLRRDVDYLVRGGRIDMIDEFTGRVVPDRHWPDGLQAAVEAKEGIAPEADGRILGSMPLQHFLRGYPCLCGMTGTAQDAADELRDLYGLKTVVVPTHRPTVRMDRPDVVFTHREAKEQAVVDEVRREHARRRPVLVGTLTVTESERLAGRLRAAGVACEVLNARNDAAEARVVARAGRLDAVTISTNMAGRGTDIRLGGADEAERDQVVALGGLYVIGTNRHESRRIDLQLRGRAGRQGDPGESRFFVSLEDDLLVRYGIGNLIPARVMPARCDGPVEHPLVRREIARAQRIVEGQNHEIRSTLSRYTEIVEEQRRRLMDRRQALLHGRAAPNVWRTVPERHGELVAACGTEAVRDAEVAVTLHHVDRAWSEHLARCADLREGIHLVRLGQQDPLARFTDEVVDVYDRMEAEIDDAVRAALDTIRVDGRTLDLASVGIKGPASTWTYLVNDNPFRDQIGQMLAGPGRTSIAIFSAMWLMPLMIAWGLADRYLRRRPRRRAAPYL